MNIKQGQYWFSIGGKKSIKIPLDSADFMYLQELPFSNAEDGNQDLVYTKQALTTELQSRPHASC